MLLDLDQVEKIVTALVENGIVSEDSKEKAKHIVQTTIAEDTKDLIGLIWSVEDVTMAAKMANICQELSEEDCRNILERMEDAHDASIGMSWDVVTTLILDYFSDNN